MGGVISELWARCSGYFISFSGWKEMDARLEHESFGEKVGLHVPRVRNWCGAGGMVVW